jgi:hypothetical protein
MSERDDIKRMRWTESSSELDELIRSSIATYAQPAPNSELAQRILRRIAAEPVPVEPRRWLPWAVALPIAACLICFFVLSQLRPVCTPGGLTNQVRTPAQLNNDVASAAPHRLPRENRRDSLRREVRPQQATIKVKVQPLPKLGVFPTPQALTPTEQALVAFASRAPIAERKAFIEAQQQPDMPLTVVAIKIQPIELPDLGMN